MKLHEFMLTPSLAGEEFSEPSWSTWRIVARLIDGDAALLTDAEREVALRLTGRSVLPTTKPREVFIAAGRRGGKSKFAALVATWRAAAEYDLSRGETARAVFVAPDREQATIGLDYARGMIHDSELLAAELAKDKLGVLTFRHRTELKVVTASYRTSRGTTLCAVVVDEASSLRADDSALPDVELVRAVRPGLDTLRGLLLVISSPHRKVGILYEAHRKYFGNDSDDRHLFLQAATLELNPKFDKTTVAESLEDDPAAAQSEYLGLFRADLEGFLDDKTVDAAIVENRRELPHVAGRRYVAFCDPSGGRGDAFTLAIAHHERKTQERGERLVLDCVRSVAAPFDPDVAVEGFAETLKEYQILKVRGDRYAGEWVEVARFFRTRG